MTNKKPKKLHSAFVAAMLGNKTSLCAVLWVAGMLAACFLAPLFYPYAPEAQDLANACAAPSFAHPCGTDILGRDMLSRILYGGRVSFAVGFLATAVSVFIGVGYGMLSGMGGGRCDAIMMRIVDILYSLPFTVFVIVLMVAFGRSVWLIFVAIGAVEWLTMARIVRAMTLEIKSRQYVDAAVALGEGTFGIMRRHILPNAAGAIIVCATLTVPSVMLLESFLSFLGLGVQAPLPSWGSLVKDGAEYMEDAPWLLVFPALVFTLTLVCLNKIGNTVSEIGDGA